MKEGRSSSTVAWRTRRPTDLLERAIQTVEKILRIHLLALEDKVKAKIRVGHPIFAWLVEYSADLYNRYQLGRDGKATMQWLKGKQCIQPSVEFAQHIMFWSLEKFKVA